MTFADAGAKVLGLAQRLRILLYRLRSDTKLECSQAQPVLALGRGVINICESVVFGVYNSPGFYSSYCYIEARRPESVIKVGSGCVFNNGCSIISDGKTVSIGQDCLFGRGVTIVDSDFHGIKPAERRGNVNVLRDDVEIGSNVFFGDNVTILKGATIGDNSVIGSGALVIGCIPANSIAVGIPARTIRSI